MGIQKGIQKAIQKGIQKMIQEKTQKGLYCISSSSKNLSIVFRVTHTVYFIILYTYPVLVEYVPILTFVMRQ